ncbi:MAG: DUF1573 domain-containing protein [Verrucomicrobia bacterium]|nr:DUF1573 domain-containing protein [Cytophagales bacterium]
MKKIIFFFLIAAFLCACENKLQPESKVSNALEVSQKTMSPEDYPVMTFAETNFDFGKIKQGDVVTHIFKFTNTGKTPLIIQGATGSCGCTVPETPKDPVSPGASSQIKVVFNSAGKEHRQSKTVTVVANTNPAETKIGITADVEIPAPAKR